MRRRAFAAVLVLALAVTACVAPLAARVAPRGVLPAGQADRPSTSAWGAPMATHEVSPDPAPCNRPPARWSRAEVRCVARRVFGEHAGAAIRVAWCESRLRPRAVSPTGDYGVWQINRRWHAWAFRLGDMFNPTWNARVAYVLSDGGTNWTAWRCRP